MRSMWIALASTALSLGWTVVQASSVYLTPASSIVEAADGTTSLHLFMDFSDESTLGGGIDLDVTGPLALVSFTPSAWFEGLDPFFSGSGSTGVADHDFAIWLGDFNGLGGVNEIGTLTLALLGDGTGAVDLYINSLFGPFQSAETFSPQSVTLSGATIDIGTATTPVPLPAAFWLLMSGLGAAGAMRRRPAAA